MTDQQKQESILSKIRKLMDKANGTDNIHEAETFMLAAQELLRKYNIDSARLTEHVHKDEKTRIQEDVIQYGDDWESMLLHYIAIHNFCKVVRTPLIKRAAVIGKIDNVNVVIYLHNFYKMKLMELSLKSYTNFLNNLPFDVKSLSKKKLEKAKETYFKDYFIGGCDGIYDAMKKAKDEAMNGSDGKEYYGLILHNDNDIDVYMKEKYHNLTTSRRSSGRINGESGAGYSNGYMDGGSIKYGSSGNIGGAQKLVK